jgi:hypothetical protein
LFMICLNWEKENAGLWSAGEKIDVGPRLQEWLKSLQTKQFHLLYSWALRNDKGTADTPYCL